MAVIDASPVDLRTALLSIRERYLALEEPRRWYTALVCAVLVNAKRLPEWIDWQVEPPAGAAIEMTPAVASVIDDLFGTPTAAILRSVPGGVVPVMQNPARVIVDPLRRPGRTIDGDTLCLVVGRERVDVPLSDPSWLWNEPDAEVPAAGYGTSAEYKPSNDYGQQQGIYCAWPADELFALGADRAAAVMAGPRPACQHHAVENVPGRRKATDVGDPPTQPTPICTLNQQQCAAKQAASGGPGGPRALVPSSSGSKEKLLAPGAFERMIQDANPAGAQLPSISDFALVMDYLNKGGGKALDSNRLYSLLAPEHSSLLLEP
jgi:hypothetical protein